jgi:carbamoyltransferase
VGLAATIHDPAIAIVDAGGRAVFAEGVERYLQHKRAYNCPPDDMVRVAQLVREHCPADAEIVAAVTWSRSQLSRLELLAARAAPGDRRLKHPAEPVWPFPDTEAIAIALRNSVSQAGLNLASSLQVRNAVTIRYYDHHLTHAASAVYTSPFEECAVAVVDGFGEHGSTSFYSYRHGELTRLDDGAPGGSAASLGFFYARLCALCGFDPVKGEEWKVMGLAAHGHVDASLYDLLRPLLAVRGLALVPGCSPSEEEEHLRLLRATMRAADVSPLAAANLARTGQLVFEEIMTELLDALHDRAPSDRLALAGGCALNSTYNGRIVERTSFAQVHIPCAPADDGTALGAALLACHGDRRIGRHTGVNATPYLGSAVSPVKLEHMLEFGRLPRMEHAPTDVHERAAALIADGKIIGWMQGRAEFGPRALGNRCVLGDPRASDMKDRINARVKFREEFRPFAPSVLDERGADYFENYQPSRYMERTLRFRPEVRARVPAVVHEDGTGRVQSVRREWNPRYYDLIAAFARRTGVPMVLNTSLNVMGRPIVHSLEDAVGMFFTTGLDALVVEDYVIEKAGCCMPDTRQEGRL